MTSLVDDVTGMTSSTRLGLRLAAAGRGGFSAAGCVDFLVTCRHSARFSVFDTVPRPDAKFRSVAVVTPSEDDDVSRPLLTERGGTEVVWSKRWTFDWVWLLLGAVVVEVVASGRRAGTAGTLTLWLLSGSASKICRL